MTGTYRWMLVAAAILGTAAPMRAEGPGSGEVTAVSLAPAAGKTEIVDNLGHLWTAAERLTGRPCDPLDPELITAMERELG